MSDHAKINLEPYRELQGVVSNFVALSDGTFVGPTGSSRSISNSIDREVLIALRHRADAVVIGGQTARVENYRQSSRFETYVFTRHLQDLTPGLHTLSFDSIDELKGIFGELKRKHALIVIEAGPSLLNKLYKAAVVDFACLTVIGESGSEERLLHELFGIQATVEVAKQSLNDTHLSIWQLNSGGVATN